MKLVINSNKTTEWAEWFAWYPVVVVGRNSETAFVWLEKVERKLFSGSWIYRPVKDDRDYWK